jgi:hypothetical protein
VPADPAPSPLVPSRQLRDLRVGEVLGDGGEGRVHAVGVACEARDLVVKLYPEGLPPPRLEHVTALVALRRHLELGLDGYAWPELLVLDGPSPVGVVLPRAPQGFVQSLRLRSGATADRLRECQYLFFPDAKTSALGLPPAGLADRLEVIAAMVAAVGWLHHHDLVYGDLSARNALYAVGSPAAPAQVFLLDCDGVVPVGAPAVVDSPDWAPPRPRASATTAADVHKLGLFAVRALAQDPRTRRIPAARTPLALRPVLTAALDPDPAARPSAEDLEAVLAGLTPGPPDPLAGPPPAWALDARGDLRIDGGGSGDGRG